MWPGNASHEKTKGRSRVFSSPAGGLTLSGRFGGALYSHLSEADRMSIQVLLQTGLSCRAIALRLCFKHSTICRELSRGKSAPTAPGNAYKLALLGGRAVTQTS